MIRVVNEFEALSDVQRTLLDMKVLREDPFYSSLNRLITSIQ